MIRRMARLVALGLLLGAAVGFGGCQEESGRAPVARFDVTPEYVPLHDGYTTVVALDGRRSQDEVDDPSGALPLRYRWELDDPGLQVVDGSLAAAQVRVKLQGDRATTVVLTVTDAAGRSARRTGYVGVTVDGPDGGVGPADAAAADASDTD